MPLRNEREARHRSDAEVFEVGALSILSSDLSEREARRRASWARMIRRIYEVDPLACGCGGELKIVSVITDPAVVDRILVHRERMGMGGQEARAPPDG